MVDLKVVRPLVVTDLNGDKGHNEIGTDGLKAISGETVNVLGEILSATPKAVDTSSFKGGVEAKGGEARPSAVSLCNWSPSLWLRQAVGCRSPLLDLLFPPLFTLVILFSFWCLLFILCPFSLFLVHLHSSVQLHWEA